MVYNIRPDILHVQLPNGACIQAHSVGSLSLPNLPIPLVVYLFNDTDLSLSLLSISDLCKAGCLATFTDDRCVVTYNGSIVVDETKAKRDALWHVALPMKQSYARAATVPYHSVPTNSSTDDDFVRFMHAAFGSPAISSFAAAVKRKYMPSLFRLTSSILAANPPHTTPTALGHLDQIRQGQQSTKRFTSLFQDVEDDASELQPPISETSINNHAYVHVFMLTETMHSDLTGKLPITSFSGMQYIIISVLDGYIHAEPMKSRHQLEYIAAYKRTINFFSNLGRKPIFQRLDNETSTALESFARGNDISIQYCAPHQHRALKAERAIRTFKNHFISTLCTVADDFPLGLWDELLPQAELCLNHLLPYPSNMSISAYAGLHGGPFDFAAHPIAPAGSKVVVHDKPAIRASWAPHGTHGYYLGPAPSHYRCYRVWTTNSRSIRISDTLAWFLQRLQMPGPSAHDFFCTAVHDLTEATKKLFVNKTINGAAHPTGQLINTLTDTLTQLAAMYPQHITPLIDTGTTTAKAHPEREQRVPIQHINSTPSTPAEPEQRVSGANDVQKGSEAPRTQSAEQYDTLQPPAALSPEAVNVPNTPIASTTTFQQTVTRPPQSTDRVTRLDAKKMLKATHAFHTSATLNLDELGKPLKYRSAKKGPNTTK